MQITELIHPEYYFKIQKFFVTQLENMLILISVEKYFPKVGKNNKTLISYLSRPSSNHFQSDF